VTNVKVLGVARHWFLGPRDQLCTEANHVVPAVHPPLAAHPGDATEMSPHTTTQRRPGRAGQ
jgi:hypothetical protein